MLSATAPIRWRSTQVEGTQQIGLVQLSLLGGDGEGKGGLTLGMLSTTVRITERRTQGRWHKSEMF